MTSDGVGIGENDVGGLVGLNHGTVSNSYATGGVSGDGSMFIGGLVGDNAGTVSKSYATGDVSGTGNYVGSLVGLNTATVSDSYAKGSVNGSSYIGLLGDNNKGGRWPIATPREASTA